MRLLLMGAPGAGKGTQAALLKNAYNIPHVSTGDMFREAIKLDSELGRKVKAYMDKGELVPDSVTVEVMADRLAKDDCKDGFLLDGYPRTLKQGQELDLLLKRLNIKLDKVFNFVVKEEILIRRILGRRVCKKCGAGYHVDTLKPKVEGVCDVCGGELISRKDDTYETIKNRISVYEKQTKPLVEYYEKQDLLVELDGSKDLNETFVEIKDILGGMNDHN
ncbi:MAG: adenylate kinase [Bacilli bacterium]|nr:adenylate kinase [Bacilli bacterium]